MAVDKAPPQALSNRSGHDTTGPSSSASQQAARYAAEKAGQEQAMPAAANALFDARALAELEKTLQDSFNQTAPAASSLPPAPSTPATASPPATPDRPDQAKTVTGRASDAPETPAAPTNPLSQPLLAGIEADSLEIRLPQPGPSFSQRLLWALLATAGVLILCAQVAWLKFDQWSLKPELRHYYQLVCDRLGCQLPDRRDISLIRTSNLSVRQHPTIAGALLVDVVLRNYATFAQPFPRLNMVFSNHRDKVLASRSFEPSEYLGGDLVGAKQMPPDQAIHLSLELVDPGQGAVSYKITLSDL